MNDKINASSILYQNPKFCNECRYSPGTYDKKGDKSEYDTSSLVSYKTGINSKRYSPATTKKTEKSGFDSESCDENYHFKTKCFQFKAVLQRVKSLLDEIKAIRKDEAVGICDFCKRYNSLNNCKRCELLAKRYGLSAVNNNEVRRQRYNMWLIKVKGLLYCILERVICQHKLYHEETIETDELRNLLNQLKIPLDTRKPYISHFLGMDTIENLTESKDILEEVLRKLKTAKREYSARSLGMDPEIREYFVDRNIDKETYGDDKAKSDAVTDKTSLAGKAPESIRKTDGTKSQATKTDKKHKLKKDLTGSLVGVKSKGKKEKVIRPKDFTHSLSGVESKGKQVKIMRPKDSTGALGGGESKGKKEKLKSPKLTSEEALMAKLIKSYSPTKEKAQKSPKKEKAPVIPFLAGLPIPKHKTPKKLVETDDAERVIECVRVNEQKEMIKGNKIVPYEDRVGHKTGSVVPMMYQVKIDFSDAESINDQSREKESSVAEKPEERRDGSLGKPAANVVYYMLSNREFIEKGWTVLPTTKMMRRMYIYKMVPSNPKSDWFKKYQHQGIVKYDTGEKFAEIDENGKGRWYYKNGRLALDFYSLQEPASGYRYVVYSSGEKDEIGRKLPVTVLAVFDYLGNGVVYDHYGNERLKYNQSEGIVVDPKVGTPGRWKWHTLNEPPVLIPVFIDTHVNIDECFQKLQFRHGGEISETTSKLRNEPDLDMITIELENLMKEKAINLSQKFKPFQIKKKALKLNDQFTLKVLDQSNIYLMFRDGQVSVKLNLGMQLIHDEIIDTDTAEAAEVATPYDRWPAKSQSIMDMQNLIKKASRLRKSRNI